jgi:LemA protein
MDLALWIALGLVVVVALWLLSSYNSLVRLNVRVDEAWSDITEIGRASCRERV